MRVPCWGHAASSSAHRCVVLCVPWSVPWWEEGREPDGRDPVSAEFPAGGPEGSRNRQGCCQRCRDQAVFSVGDRAAPSFSVQWSPCVATGLVDVQGP